MLEELEAIDTSAIEELQRIKGEQEVLADRLTRMEEKRGKVSEEVFMRVRSDYETRMHTLEQEAAPLKEAARREYGRLKKLLEDLGEAARTARLDREELELRHELGEFSQEEYEKLVEEHEGRVREHQQHLSEAEDLQKRFQSAFLDPSELEIPEAPGDGTVEPDAAPALELDEEEIGPERQDAETQDVAPPAGAEEIPPSEEPAVPYPETGGETSGQDSPTPEDVLDAAFPEATAAIPVPPELAEDSAETGETAGGDEEPVFAGDSTMLISWPKLIGQAEDGSTVEYPVAGSTTTLGRDPDNDIVLSGKKVSRRHAEVVLAEDGYVIRDLGSTVGTLVNGVQVTEWKLSNGDSVQLGDVVLVFMET